MKNQYYKYRPLYSSRDKNPKVVEPNTELIFKRAEIFFSVPAKFNDPFDCNLRTHVDDSTDAEWETYLDEMMDKCPAFQVNLLKVKQDKLWKTDPALADKIGKDTQKKHYNESSVLCLAKKGNSVPMFSYYADSHHGIAIEFSFSDQEVPCGFPYQVSGGKPYDGKIVFRDVEYPSEFPELNYHRIRNSDKLVRHLLFTKSHDWSHEEEFRIFRRGVPKSAVSFDRKLLTKVIFGCKTDAADIELVKGWLNGWPSDVILAKAEPATDNFELRVKQFDIVNGTQTATTMC